MVFRHFEESDYGLLCDFFADLNRKDRRHVNWNWARFEWMYGHPELDLSSLNAVGLWLEDGKVVGAAVYDMYFGEAFCGVLPGFEALYPRVLDYAWENLRDESGLGLALPEDAEDEIAAALAAGFAPAEQREILMRIGLDRPLSAPLPAGLRLAQIDEDTDQEALGWLFWQGFDHGTDRAAYDASERIPARPRPHADPRLSLTAVTASGEPVACCCLWYRPDTDYAYVEPVCTVPAWRGRGAAKALLFHALDRARTLGAKEAWVISDQVFYEKLGFRKERVFPFYWKT